MQNKLKEYIRDIINEIIEEDEELEEATLTGNIAGYDTPMAFTVGRTTDKKKKRKLATNSTGYKIVKEELDKNDLKAVQKLIRSEVADILRDIWLKRTIWK